MLLILRDLMAIEVASFRLFIRFDFSLDEPMGSYWEMFMGHQFIVMILRNCHIRKVCHM